MPDSLPDALRACAGRLLSRGLGGSRAARAASKVWEAIGARAVARPIRLPPGARVIGVGGAVLGGAGKTPVAIALATALAARGERVALVGHAYRAKPGRARRAAPEDPVAEVGDDALLAARMLAGTGARVVVAPRRQDALDFAAQEASILVVDGLLQAAPSPLHAAILVLDGAAPWGSGACPPAGDLRAPPAALLAAADHVVALSNEGAPRSADRPPGTLDLPSRVTGAGSLSLADLAPLRVGLLLAIARPDRVEAALARAGVRPVASLFLADHAVPSARALARAARAPVDAWLTTARCAVKLPATIGAAPVLALGHQIDVRALAACVASRLGLPGP